MDVGATLQSAREGQGLSLDELADRTKIGVRLLRALERNDVNGLPSGIFMRGYLRAYAKEVGLDPAVIVDSYLAQFAPAGAAARSTGDRREHDAAPDLVELNEYGALDPSAESGSEAGKAIAIALVSLAFVAYLSLGTSHDAAPADPPPAPLAETVPAAPRTDGAVVPAADVREPVATSGNSLEIQMEATGPCWVEAIVEGRRFVYRLMTPGDRATITTGELTLRVGEPSAFRFSINGKAARLPGRPGQPVSVVIDAGNFTDFLAP